MADNAELISAVIKYRTAKERLKQEYRNKLHESLRPELVEVGRQVVLARASGATVDAIAADFGTKNRTFIYAALDAFGDYKASLEATLPEPTQPTAENEVLDTPTYTLDWFPNELDQIHVTIGNVFWTVTRDDGDWIFPDEWFAAKGAERALFKTIIQEIEGA